MDRSQGRAGRWVLRATASMYSAVRVVQLDPPSAPRRVLVNDTFRALQSAPAAGVGIFVSHRATVAETVDDVDTALVPWVLPERRTVVDGHPRAKWQ